MSATEASGGIFAETSFLVTQRVPRRSHYCQLLKANGGAIVKVEKDAQMIIADSTRLDAPLGSIDFKWIEQCVEQGALLDTQEFRNGSENEPVREVGSLRPPKTNRRRVFNKEDDAVLYHYATEYIRKGYSERGNSMYKLIEQHNKRHPWQSWRDRWLNHMKPRLAKQKAQDGAQRSPSTSTSVARVSTTAATIDEDDSLFVQDHSEEEASPQHPNHSSPPDHVPASPMLDRQPVTRPLEPQPQMQSAHRTLAPTEAAPIAGAPTAVMTDPSPFNDTEGPNDLATSERTQHHPTSEAQSNATIVPLTESMTQPLSSVSNASQQDALPPRVENGSAAKASFRYPRISEAQSHKRTASFQQPTIFKPGTAQNTSPLTGGSSQIAFATTDRELQSEMRVRGSPVARRFSMNERPMKRLQVDFSGNASNGSPAKRQRLDEPEEFSNGFRVEDLIDTPRPSRYRRSSVISSTTLGGSVRYRPTTSSTSTMDAVFEHDEVEQTQRPQSQDQDPSPNGDNEETQYEDAVSQFPANIPATSSQEPSLPDGELSNMDGSDVDDSLWDSFSKFDPGHTKDEWKAFFRKEIRPKLAPQREKPSPATVSPIFTREDEDLLLLNASDIMRTPSGSLRTAFEDWAQSVGKGTATQWQDLFDKKVRPVALLNEQFRQSRDKVHNRDQPDSPLLGFSIHQDSSSSVNGSESEQENRDPRTFSPAPDNARARQKSPEPAHVDGPVVVPEAESFQLAEPTPAEDPTLVGIPAHLSISEDLQPEYDVPGASFESPVSQSQSQSQQYFQSSTNEQSREQETGGHRLIAVEENMVGISSTTMPSPSAVRSAVIGEAIVDHQSSSESEDDGSDMDRFMAAREREGYTKKQIFEAMMRSSMDPDGALKVLWALRKGRPMPEYPGIFSERSDKVLRAGNAREMKLLEEFHGKSMVKERIQFLQGMKML